MLSKIYEWIRHNQALTGSFVVCAIIIVMGFGCQITTKSPLTGQQVTRHELTVEAEAYAKNLDYAYQDLDKKEAIVKTILEAGLAYAQGGVSPIGVASTLLSVVGLGAVVDNRRKDSVIKSKSNALAAVNELVNTVIKTEENNES